MTSLSVAPTRLQSSATSISAMHANYGSSPHIRCCPTVRTETLYQLTKLPAAMLLQKLADGSINPKTERKDVAVWRKGEQGDEVVTVDGKTIEHKPSLSEQLKAARTEIE